MDDTEVRLRFNFQEYHVHIQVIINLYSKELKTLK